MVLLNSYVGRLAGHMRSHTTLFWARHAGFYRVNDLLATGRRALSDENPKGTRVGDKLPHE